MQGSAKIKVGSYIYFAVNSDNYYGYIDELRHNHIGLYYINAQKADKPELYDFMFRTNSIDYDYFVEEDFDSYIVLEANNIKAADLKGLIGCDITLSEYMSSKASVPLPCNFNIRVNTDITPEVLLKAVDRSLFCDNFEEGKKTFLEYIYLLSQIKAKLRFPEDESAAVLTNLCSFKTNVLPFTDEQVLAYVISRVSRNPGELNSFDLFHLKDYLEKYIDSKGKSLAERDFTDITKEEYIKAVYEDIGLNNVTYEEILKYREIIEELCDKGSKNALKQKGYGCYGKGNRAFETNWDSSLECFERLYMIDGDPFIANTLGYIYYYGRTNGGVPQYDKAREYFSVGAFAGYYQSMYKMGDIYANGFGVRKQPYIAYRLYSDVYNSTYDDFRQWRYDYEFPDAALRVGNCYKDGIGVDVDYISAYRYYLEAECAIKKRIEYKDNFGDKKVLANIQEGLKFCEDKLGDKIDKTVSIWKRSTPWLMGLASLGSRRVEAYYKWIGTGRVKFTIALLESDGTRVETGILVTAPEIGFCELMGEPVLYADNVKKFWCMNPDHFVYNQVHFNESLDRFEFTMYDELVASVSAEYYTFNTRRALSEDAACSEDEEN